MNICGEKQIVFIYIGGVSSSDIDFTKKYNKDDGTEYIFESVSYKSSKSPDYVIDDILTGRMDAMKLETDGEIKTDSERKELRLNMLVSIISFYMRYTTKKIVIIGVSHGSLIVHSAILKIKSIYTPIEDLMNIFKQRIIVLTLGSPKYLPKNLLSSLSTSDEITMKYGNVYNFYNIKDKIYYLLDIVKTIGLNELSYLNFPNLNISSDSGYITYGSGDVNKRVFYSSEPHLNPKYKFDSSTHIFYVKNTEYLSFTKPLFDSNNLLIYELCKNTLSIIFFHSVLFNLFPIFEDYLHIIHYMRNIDLVDTSPEYKKLLDDGSLTEFDRNTLYTPPQQKGGIKIKKLKKYLNSK